MTKHKIINDCEEKGKYKVIDDWHVAGAGETLERNCECPCGRSWREVYIYSCMIDNETEERI